MDEFNAGVVMRLWKMQAVGNDFLLADLAAAEETEWPSLAKALCSRHYGLGADGLLAAGLDEGGAPVMRMWNPDGTEDFCGNGLRCGARYLLDRGLVSAGRFPVNTYRKQVHVEIVPSAGSSSPKITIDMGKPWLVPSSIPILLDDRICPVLDYPLEILGRRLLINSISTGVTHTVIFSDDKQTDATFEVVSAALETHPLFPERTCVIWTSVLNEERLAIRIWERGVGETLGCGSGACAAAAIARLAGRVGNRVVVVSRGGELLVTIDSGLNIALTGEAEYICQLDLRWRGDILPD